MNTWHFYSDEQKKAQMRINERFRSPYFAEAVGEKSPFALKVSPAPIPEDMVAPDDGWIDDWIEDALNAPMLARDAANYVPRPASPVVIQEPTKTSHGPIAGLTRLGAVDHLFGTRFVHGD